jgi:hypothetical protein
MRKSNYFFCLKALCLLLLVAENAFAQAWRQIRPLHTSRKQVERLLGRPKVIGGVNTYDFTNETVSIFYQEHSCQIDSQGWNVPVNTVTSVRIEPRKKARLSGTQWDLSKFRKEQGSYDDPYSSYFLFRNEEDGITLSVVSDVLQAYIYGPKRGDTAKRCPNYSVAEEQRLRDCMPIVFTVDCSSDEIDLGQSVSCRLRFDSTPLDFSPTIEWSVSKNATFVGEGQEIKVSLKNRNAGTLLVVGRITSPNTCMRTGSIALRVVARN